LLEDYLERVVAALDTPGMAASTQLNYSVTVAEDPTLYVHTGLLARMESEDELATVLGHEMSHVENRHMLRQQRSARNKKIGLGVGEEGDAYKEGKYGKAARIGVVDDLMIGLGLQLAFVAAVNGYGRDLEHEADLGGFEKMAAGGGLPRAARQPRRLRQDGGLLLRIPSATGTAHRSVDLMPAYFSNACDRSSATTRDSTWKWDDCNSQQRNSNACAMRCPTTRKRIY